MPGHLEVDRCPGRERSRKLDAHHRAVLGPPQLPSGRCEPLDRDPPDEPFAREVEHGAAGEV